LKIGVRPTEELLDPIRAELKGKNWGEGRVETERSVFFKTKKAIILKLHRQERSPRLTIGTLKC